ncbi:RUS family member 1 isoform X1 [Amyelois transitella]|uniref:RUS family member 1 isoform X1 n=2 Tax=Amyelois transitella TaxID=680683 RepID=UPI0029901371|nr:RUS family member 1 isoform X1 [Amyelois transitella]
MQADVRTSFLVFSAYLPNSLLKEPWKLKTKKMYTIHEGEILLKEKYGSSSLERFYIKPPDQANLVIVDNQKFSDVSSWFARIFLPHGYPDSVSKDYTAYQIWDTAQAFCSTITGTLATQEVLRGVGVGNTSATPLAATVTWVFKDGCGHLGKILFAFSHGTYLDAYSKKWRLYADTLNDAAMCIEIALPLFKSYTTFALCVSTVMKAIVGVAGGATRAAMTQHHAVRGNMADVSAKDSAQETAVNLVASIAALLILTIFGNSLLIFIVMIILHIACNYLAVRAICLRTLNEPRFLQFIDLYLRKEVIAAPCDINRNEPIIFYQLGPNLLDLKLCGFQLRMGKSIKPLMNKVSKAAFLSKLTEVYTERNYMLVPNISNRKMFILFKEGASTDEILCAYFHAVLLSIITCAINDYPLTVYENSVDTRPFAQVCRTLQSAEWSRESSDLVDSIGGFQYEPSHDLTAYVDMIVQKEWNQIREGLTKVGWDLSKHLLVVDEWRVGSKLKPIDPIAPTDSEDNHYTVIAPTSKIIPFGEILSDLESDQGSEKETFTVEPEDSGLRLRTALMSKSETLALKAVKSLESNNTKLSNQSSSAMKSEDASLKEATTSTQNVTPLPNEKLKKED